MFQRMQTVDTDRNYRRCIRSISLVLILCISTMESHGYFELKGEILHKKKEERKESDHLSVKVAQFY
ncbi:hypothetical protein XELAEV_18037187mg [Xenopus laevis]|uniref:Uncharacterized protein n=1 Tax=Xenopus laevis TaxID=8355 RepID=A0A974HA57_XENLA|nr:hypothetical protein XELAEV_18037187mg [Xenopus laevis]